MSTKWRSSKGGVASFAVGAWLSFIVNMDVVESKATWKQFTNRLALICIAFSVVLWIVQVWRDLCEDRVFQGTCSQAWPLGPQRPSLPPPMEALEFTKQSSTRATNHYKITTELSFWLFDAYCTKPNFKIINKCMTTRNIVLTFSVKQQPTRKNIQMLIAVCFLIC